ncbi:MAG: PA2778 family cysteine peptidase [Chromatiales bacterium]
MCERRVPGRAWAALAVALALSGCAARGPVLAPRLPPEARAEAVDLDHTPFFPQQAYRCGPAALATVLVASGADASPDRLADQVFLPGRRGSLQAELIAAVRRHGRVPYRLRPELSALLAELRAGRPVLVLQDLGVGPFPVWHYAVVTGYDPDGDVVRLRSGTERRKTMEAAGFARTWERAGHWGLLALHPGALPAADDPQGFAKAVAGLEATGRWEDAGRSYAAGIGRWPDDAILRLGLANVHYRLGEPALAERGYRAAIDLDPGSAAARNNLARTLLDRGCRREALETVDRALALPEVPPDLHRALRETRAAIRARPAADAQAGCALAAGVPLRPPMSD